MRTNDDDTPSNLQKPGNKNRELAPKVQIRLQICPTSC